MKLIKEVFFQDEHYDLLDRSENFNNNSEDLLCMIEQVLIHSNIEFKNRQQILKTLRALIENQETLHNAIKATMMYLKED